MRIVVVDDEPEGRARVELVLRRELAAVELVAADGAGAMVAMERRRDGVVLILSDLVMPEVGGVGLARRVREAGLCPRVVPMTGYPLEGDTGELERLGVVACLRKPFTMAQLAGAVHDALSRTSD